MKKNILFVGIIVALIYSHTYKYIHIYVYVTVAFYALLLTSRGISFLDLDNGKDLPSREKRPFQFASNISGVICSRKYAGKKNK